MARKNPVPFGPRLDGGITWVATHLKRSFGVRRANEFLAGVRKHRLPGYDYSSVWPWVLSRYGTFGEVLRYGPISDSSFLTLVGERFSKSWYDKPLRDESWPPINLKNLRKRLKTEPCEIITQRDYQGHPRYVSDEGEPAAKKRISDFCRHNDNFSKLALDSLSESGKPGDISLALSEALECWKILGAVRTIRRGAADDEWGKVGSSASKQKEYIDKRIAALAKAFIEAFQRASEFQRKDLTAYHCGRELRGLKFSTRYIGTGEGGATPGTARADTSGINPLGPGIYFIDDKGMALAYCRYVDKPVMYKVKVDITGFTTGRLPREDRQRKGWEAIKRRYPGLYDYSDLARKLGSKKANKMLVEAGIPGAYTNLHGKTELAVFDLDRVEVVERWKPQRGSEGRIVRDQKKNPSWGPPYQFIAHDMKGDREEVIFETNDLAKAKRLFPQSSVPKWADLLELTTNLGNTLGTLFHSRIGGHHLVWRHGSGERIDKPILIQQQSNPPKKAKKKMAKKKAKRKLHKTFSKWVDAQKMAKKHPDTFEVPALARLKRDVKIGDLVKWNIGAERLWLLVVDVEGETLTGLISNDPLDKKYSFDDVVRIKLKHVYDYKKGTRKSTKRANDFLDELVEKDKKAPKKKAAKKAKKKMTRRKRNPEFKDGDLITWESTFQYKPTVKKEIRNLIVTGERRDQYGTKFVGVYDPRYGDRDFVRESMLEDVLADNGKLTIYKPDPKEFYTPAWMEVANDVFGKDLTPRNVTILAARSPRYKARNTTIKSNPPKKAKKKMAKKKAKSPRDKIGDHWSPIIMRGIAHARQQKTASKALWATLAVLRDTDIAMYEYSKQKGKASADESAIYGIRESIGYKMSGWMAKAKVPKREINKFLDDLTSDESLRKNPQLTKKEMRDLSSRAKEETIAQLLGYEDIYAWRAAKEQAVEEDREKSGGSSNPKSRRRAKVKPLITEDELLIAEAYALMREEEERTDRPSSLEKFMPAAIAKRKKRGKRPRAKKPDDIVGVELSKKEMKAAFKRLKAREKKTPTAKELVAKCQKLWAAYCRKPGVTKLRAVDKHCEAMKASKAKSATAERRRCMQSVRAEAKARGWVLTANPGKPVRWSIVRAGLYTADINSKYVEVEKVTADEELGGWGEAGWIIRIDGEAVSEHTLPTLAATKITAIATAQNT